MVLFILGSMFSLALAYTAVSPVFMYTSIGAGGWNFTDQQIAYFLALAGASQAAWMLLAFPPLQARYGTGALMRTVCLAYPFFFASYPIFNEMLRHGYTTAFWIGWPIVLVLASGVSMAFGESLLHACWDLFEELLTWIRCSLRSALCERHCADFHCSRHCQCPGTYSEQWRTRCRSYCWDKPVRSRCEASMGRRSLGLVCVLGRSSRTQRSGTLYSREGTRTAC